MHALPDPTQPETVIELLAWACSRGYGLMFEPYTSTVQTLPSECFEISWTHRRCGESITWTYDRSEEAILECIPQIIQAIDDRESRYQEFRVKPAIVTEAS